MAHHVPTTSMGGGVGTEKTGLRKTLKRWKDKWRIPSAASSRKSITSAPTTRPPTNTSSIAPPPHHLPTVPGSPALPPPLPAALFTPTTETFIHSPADPRNRSISNSPTGTLRKSRPASRRNTVPADYLASAAHAYLPTDPAVTPLNVVTTTIVAGGDNVKRKRQSRLRLSLSKRGSVLSPMSSPSTPNFFERSASRAAVRFETVNEGGAVRKRADSDRESLVEEDAVVRRDRMKRGAMGGGDVRLVEIAT